ncbi:hypothetical protein [Oleiharenicola lentus]|uniref:hypothetical protein n=1 Tax=Oleiharenicola lentus TaxID=2508720 RepID=UPI003F6802CE
MNKWNEDYGDDVDLAQQRFAHREEEEKRRSKEYSAWCESMETCAGMPVPELKDGFSAETDFHPDVWLDAGVSLIESGKPTRDWSIKSPNYFDGFEDMYPRYSLDYTVIQMGTEFFLKGMWLLQFAELRPFRSNLYLAPNARSEINAKLKALSHDILDIASEVGEIPEYATDEESKKFLRIITGVFKFYYYPLHGRASHWAHARYPKKFYMDRIAQAVPDSWRKYPYQWTLLRLFRQAENRVYQIWFPDGERGF